MQLISHPSVVFSLSLASYFMRAALSFAPSACKETLKAEAWHVGNHIAKKATATGLPY